MHPGPGGRTRARLRSTLATRRVLLRSPAGVLETDAFISLRLLRRTVLPVVSAPHHAAAGGRDSGILAGAVSQVCATRGSGAGCAISVQLHASALDLDVSTRRVSRDRGDRVFPDQQGRAWAIHRRHDSPLPE